MTARPTQTVAFILALALAACSQPTGEISRDAEPFDGIAETASISLLGNEPFWGLEIEPTEEGYAATYSSPEDMDNASFPVSRFAGNNGIGFSGEFEDMAVQVALTPGECSDTMSDRTYPYVATVAMGDRTLFGCAYTSDEPFTGDETP